MKFNLDKITHKQFTVEGLSLETGEEKKGINKSKAALAIFLTFSFVVTFYVVVRVSLNFDYYFTNKPQQQIQQVK